MGCNYDVITYVLKYPCFRKAWGTHFADIITIITIFVKKIFKDSRKGKIVRNYALKCNLYLYFLIKQDLMISSEKMLMSAELRVSVT